jgi:hypothetical protein
MQPKYLESGYTCNIISRIAVAVLAGLLISLIPSQTNGQDIKDFLTAVDKHDIEKVQKLIGEGIDVNAANAKGATALMVAALNGQLDIVRLLLRNGANVNLKMKDIGVTALHWASQDGNADIVKELLSAGADIHSALSNGQNALIMAANSGHADVVRILLDKGADPNAVLKNGQTVLRVTAEAPYPVAQSGLVQTPVKSRYAEIVDMLLKKGAKDRIETITAKVTKIDYAERKIILGEDSIYAPHTEFGVRCTANPPKCGDLLSTGFPAEVEIGQQVKISYLIREGGSRILVAITKP